MKKYSKELILIISLKCLDNLTANHIIIFKKYDIFNANPKGHFGEKPGYRFIFFPFSNKMQKKKN